MIKINVEVNYKPWLKKIKSPKKYFNIKLKKIAKITPTLLKKKIIFTILLTNSTCIKRLNKKFRNLNKSTDALSFPYLISKNLKFSKKKYTYIGDIAACYEIINSRSKKNSFNDEFDKVWIHGFLHLLGFDHKKDKDYFKMQKVEKKFLNSITK